MSDIFPPEIRARLENLPLHEQQMFLLGQIFGQLKGVNDHFAVLNGQVSEHDKAIKSLEATRSEQKGERRAIAKVSGIVAGSVTLGWELLKLAFHWK